jgi:hypothetical protein
MWEEVRSTTTGGEWVWRSFGDGWAIFFDVAGSNGFQEGSGRWMDSVSASGDAFGCWEENKKGLGRIGSVQAEQ